MYVLDLDACSGGEGAGKWKIRRLARRLQREPREPRLYQVGEYKTIVRCPANIYTA